MRVENRKGMENGRAAEAFDDVYIFVPDAKQIIRIAEGTGDNLLTEDEETGYVDYIMYEQHSLDVGMPVEDGGQLMMKELVREKYGCLADSIPDVLNLAYENSSIGYVVLA